MTTLFSSELANIRDNPFLHTQKCEPYVVGEGFIQEARILGEEHTQCKRWSSPAYHSWRYYVAAGKSLKKIERLQQLYLARREIFARFAQAVGAKDFDGSYFDFGIAPSDERRIFGEMRIDGYRYFVRGKNPDFRKYSPVSPGVVPNPHTERGKKLEKITRILGQYCAPEASFARWLQWADISPNPHGIGNIADRSKKSVCIEHIAGDVIIKIPVVVSGFFGEDGKGGCANGTQESWAVPPGAIPLPVSQYFSKLEELGAFRPLPSLNNPSHVPL